MGWPRKNPTTGTYLCPLCNTPARTDVTDSRPTADGFVRRRRTCQACAGRFTTLEVPSEVMSSEAVLAIARQSSKARSALNAFIVEYNALHRSAHSAAKRKAT